MSYLDIIRAQRTPLPLVTQSCVGQTIIVTGSNTGLGLEAAKHFVELDAMRVVLAVRSLPKGEAAKSSIEAATSRLGVIEVWGLDLASQDSIRAFIKRAAEDLDRIDAVVENAGVAFQIWTEIGGSETTIAVNVIGTMMLAVLLLPILRESGRKWNILPRITVVTSELHAASAFVEGKEDDIFAALNAKSDKNITDR
jgi:NAD(P)-dependent dehydrogenase (short-subunit alcohol dehydrogenase family)